MLLETIFYTLGIATMIVAMIIMISIVFLLYSIKKKTTQIKESAISKVVGLVRDRNTEIASAIGLTVVGMIVDRFKKGKKA